ncbi:MAG: MFS transporter [Candidatus Heimdallarchaeaceae archaeon]
MPIVHSSKPRLALSVLIFGHFLNHFYAYVLGAAMIVIRLPEHLDLLDPQVGLLGTIQMIIFAIFSIIVGIVGDKWLKSKKIFVPVGVFFMAIHLFIAAYAKSLGVLIVAAIVVGFGASFYHPVAYASIADLYEEKKGLTMALNAALGMIGTSIAPALVVTFDKLIGWRKFFIICGGIAVVFSIILYFAFENLINYRFSEKEISEKNERKNSMNTKERVKYWFKTELFVILTFAIITCLFYSSFRSGIFKITNQWLSIIFVDLYAFTTVNAGIITTIILVIGGLTAIIGGIVSDKISTTLTMVISLGGSTIILAVIFGLGSALPNFVTIGLYFVFIAFLYFSSAASTKYVAENVPQGSRTTGISFLFAFPSTIASLFPWIFGIVKENAQQIWSIGFLFLLALLGTVMGTILFIRDIKLGKFRGIRRKKATIQLVEEVL